MFLMMGEYPSKSLMVLCMVAISHAPFLKIIKKVNPLNIAEQGAYFLFLGFFRSISRSFFFSASIFSSIAATIKALSLRVNIRKAEGVM